MKAKFNIIYQTKVSSTNDYAKKLIQTEHVKDFTVVYAEKQLIGRGQRLNSWHSEEKKNLTFSIIVFPTFLTAENQFYLSKAVSIGITQYLKNSEYDFKIKWPNDIYFKNKKICGILIENSISGMSLKNSVIGIGLNVNQLKFPAELPTAISLSNITSIDYDLQEELNYLLESIYSNLEFLKKLNFPQIDHLYHKNLYKINQLHIFKDSKGEFKGTITGTLPNGKLQIKTEHNELKEYNFKEVEFL